MKQVGGVLDAESKAARSARTPEPCGIRRLLGFVPVDFDVLGGAAGGDQVGFAVVVEVGDGEVFAGHAFVVAHLLRLVFSFFVGNEELYAARGTSGGGAEFAAPADGK